MQKEAAALMELRSIFEVVGLRAGPVVVMLHTVQQEIDLTPANLSLHASMFLKKQEAHDFNSVEIQVCHHLDSPIGQTMPLSLRYLT